MRFALCLLLVVACGPSNEGKPIEVVTVPAPTASAKPVVVDKEQPPPVGPETAVANSGFDIKARDPRKLVVRDGEADQLRSLLDNTQKTSPDRPQILRKLAEANVALARSGTTEARQHAIDAYTSLKNDHPNYAQLDEVYYYLGLEYELANNLKSARATWYDLIKNRPDSKFIPYAYFAFGEVFFIEAANDPTKWDLCIQAYNETLKYPKTPLTAAALYREGVVYKKKGEASRAAEKFSRLDKEFSQTEEAKLPR